MVMLTALSIAMSLSGPIGERPTLTVEESKPAYVRMAGQGARRFNNGTISRGNRPRGTGGNQVPVGNSKGSNFGVANGVGSSARPGIPTGQFRPKPKGIPTGQAGGHAKPGQQGIKPPAHGGHGGAPNPGNLQNIEQQRESLQSKS
jgi:hypothetical protein